VAVGTTTLPARELLDRLLTIERHYGRERPYPGAARTLDLDLILLGDAIEVSPDIYVPHPRFRDRFFVLGPLAAACVLNGPTIIREPSFSVARNS
jgi:2-amino-4-hydroxy-6-hydroxymethyldihydropteridine diphosphokinase